MDILQAIIDFFVSIGRFIALLLGGILQFFEMLPFVTSFVTMAASYLPLFLSLSFTLTVSLLIVKLVLDLL